MRNRRHTDRGGSMVEFAILVPFWLSLLLGTFWLGSAMVHEQQVTQMARDLGSMYCRGVDFSTNGGLSSSTTLSEVVAGVGTITASGGTGSAVFSTIEYIGSDICSGCTNTGYFVFTQQYQVGNTAVLAHSLWGTAPAGDIDASNNIPSSLYTTDTNCRSKFSLIPAPQGLGTDGYTSGSPIYVVEVGFSDPGQVGYTNGATYAYSVF